MQLDFHYYATYCAAYIAGYTHEECLDICYSAQMPDCCSSTFLSKIGAPITAATVQSQIELINCRTDIIGLQDITRIWSSFHFLPKDLYAQKKASKLYLDKYRLICGPDGELSEETVNLAKGRSLQAVGLAMHVIADTWAHKYFAGTPSFVINNTNYHFYEMPDDILISFRHSTSSPDDLENHLYSNSVYHPSENSIMNLGHGRAGHLPDYSFMKYRYLPAWADYEEITKDNSADYYDAFCQILYALKFYRDIYPSYIRGSFDREAAEPYKDRIMEIITKRQLDASADWRQFGESLSGCEIPDFDPMRYCIEYTEAPKDDKADTFLGRFIGAAIAQKSMVTNRIFHSGSLIAGFSIDITDPVKGLEELKKLYTKNK